MSQLRQSVNFYRDEFKKPEIKLPAIQMAAIALVALVLVSIVGGYQVWSLQSLVATIEKQAASRDQLQSQYEMMEANFVEPTEDKSLLDQLQTLSKDVNQKQKLKQFLESESSKSLFSFAAVLDALANSDVGNVWLTEVSIKTTGQQYELKGISQHADAIPNYIDQLKQAEALQGTSFNVFSIERDKEKESLLHFTLSSEMIHEPDEG